MVGANGRDAKLKKPTEDNTAFCLEIVDIAVPPFFVVAGDLNGAPDDEGGATDDEGTFTADAGARIPHAFISVTIVCIDATSPGVITDVPLTK